MGTKTFKGSLPHDSFGGTRVAAKLLWSIDTSPSDLEDAVSRRAVAAKFPLRLRPAHVPVNTNINHCTIKKTRPVRSKHIAYGALHPVVPPIDSLIEYRINSKRRMV